MSTKGKGVLISIAIIVAFVGYVKYTTEATGLELTEPTVLCSAKNPLTPVLDTPYPIKGYEKCDNNKDAVVFSHPTDKNDENFQVWIESPEGIDTTAPGCLMLTDEGVERSTCL